MFCRRARSMLRNPVKTLNAYSAVPGPAELPRKLRRFERKPWVTNVNELKRRARLEREQRVLLQEGVLNPPENGLLVKSLVPVARRVMAARAKLFACASRLAGRVVPVFHCGVCGEVHVGATPHLIRTCDVRGSQKNKQHTWERGNVGHVLPEVDSFHLYDRLGRAVSHDERLQVDRVPAIVELCIQAGVDLPEYPTRRREFPVYRVAGKLLDFEKRFPKHDHLKKGGISTSGFWETPMETNGAEKIAGLDTDGVKEIAKEGMRAWEEMQSGAVRLMEKYGVQTCGYCTEIQVGPKGHRVRQCQAFKHQMRDGQHDWQEATGDDVVPPVYVWHVKEDYGGGALVDDLKGYYAKLPAVVELFAQAGAEVREDYASLSWDDVVVPELDEQNLVV